MRGPEGGEKLVWQRVRKGARQDPCHARMRTACPACRRSRRGVFGVKVITPVRTAASILPIPPKCRVTSNDFQRFSSTLLRRGGGDFDFSRVFRGRAHRLHATRRAPVRSRFGGAIPSQRTRQPQDIFDNLAPIALFTLADSGSAGIFKRVGDWLKPGAGR